MFGSLFGFVADSLVKKSIIKKLCSAILHFLYIACSFVCFLVFEKSSEMCHCILFKFKFKKLITVLKSKCKIAEQGLNIIQYFFVMFDFFYLEIFVIFLIKQTMIQNIDKLNFRASKTKLKLTTFRTLGLEKKTSKL